MRSILEERGFIHQSTSNHDPDIAYIGFDCTSPDLHVGSLVQLMALRHCPRPIVVIGQGTTRIGDPSGKDTTRKILDHQTIQTNAASIQETISRFVPNATFLNNADWLDKLSYLDFLQQYGRHISVSRLLSQDSVHSRLTREQNLSFLEFNYAIIQAFDFLHLAKHHGCDTQIGGSDQWGNIITGIELGRKAHNMELHGITTPLILNAEGQKMGKTTSGAISLNQDPQDTWQFWRNTHDQDVIRFLKLFTEIPLDEIRQYENLTDEAINQAKIRLANEATKINHGSQQDSKLSLTGEPVPAFRLFAHLTGSNATAKKLIQQGGAYIDGNKLSPDQEQPITPATGMVLSQGKKKHRTVKIR